MMKSDIFGAYDIRGKYPEDINENSVEILIPAILKSFKKKKQLNIIVGCDTRLSSPNLYRSALRTLRATPGAKPIPVGVITTPMIYFLVGKFKADGGIIITASHNPKNYNGIKVIDSVGLPVGGKEIYELYKSLR